MRFLTLSVFLSFAGWPAATRLVTTNRSAKLNFADVPYL